MTFIMDSTKLNEVRKTPLSEEAKKRIDSAVYVSDSDNPPLTAEELRNLKPAHVRHPEWFRPV